MFRGSLRMTRTKSRRDRHPRSSNTSTLQSVRKSETVNGRASTLPSQVIFQNKALRAMRTEENSQPLVDYKFDNLLDVLQAKAAENFNKTEFHCTKSGLQYSAFVIPQKRENVRSSSSNMTNFVNGAFNLADVSCSSANALVEGVPARHTRFRKKRGKQKKQAKEPDERCSTTSSKANFDLLVEEYGILCLAAHENLRYLHEVLVFEDTLFVFCESLREYRVLRSFFLENQPKNKEEFEQEIVRRSPVTGKNAWQWTETYAAYVVQKVISALSYLHRRNQVLRAVSVDNIFISKDGTIKLGDLSSARQLSVENPGLSGIVGNIAYLAPEMAVSGKYGTSVDIWAVGVVARELVTGELAQTQVEGREPRTRLEALLHLMSRHSADTNEPFKRKGYTTAFKEFIDICERPSALEKKITKRTVSVNGFSPGMMQPIGLKKQTNGVRSSRISSVNQSSKSKSSGSHDSLRKSESFEALGAEKTIKIRPSATSLLGHPFVVTACDSTRFAYFMNDMYSYNSR